MEATSIRSAAAWQRARQIDWSAVAVSLLGFALVVYLGLEGGGFDPIVHDQTGIAIWWIVLLGALVGALPRRELGPAAWIALGLVGAFAIWTALSLTWTESSERTAAELARMATYLGVFVLALFACDSAGARKMIGAVGAGIGLISIVALLSRLHPAWFPEADQTARFLSGGRNRLSYPLDYWNALAGLIAIGLPLVLELATRARAIPVRALAAALLPAMALTAFLTLSRSGIAAAILAVALFLALTSDRLGKALTLLPAAGGSAILIVAADRRDAFQDGLLNAAAHQQGDEMVPIVLAVCLAVGAIQAGISFALRKGMRPRWTFPSRRQTTVAAVAGVVVALLALAAIDAPGRASDAWSEFKQEGGPGDGTERLTSFAGQSRYQLWSAAADQNASKPLTGTGPGTFEFWWAREGDEDETVRDAHSLYMQTLGELGIVGLALLAAFLLTLFAAGARRLLRLDDDRPMFAAAIAGCAAFCLTAAFDWMWQIPVLPVALLLLGAVLVAPSGPYESTRRVVGKLPFRGAVAAVAVAALVAIAIPLAATSLVRESEADVRDGALVGALDAARDAQRVQPGAATPRLQQALVLEEMGELRAAAEAARAATERESTNWRTWLVLARIEAALGESGQAVRDYRRAKSLNPHFSLFDD
jgi:O-antigen ligase/polysaccharide polymerase Wzy-like membrane protein